MGDMGDMYNLFAKDRKEKRGSNNRYSTQLLIDSGIKFESKNNGVHLIVEGIKCKIDFWPSTGKFITRNGKRGRGVFNLIKLCNKKPA